MEYTPPQPQTGGPGAPAAPSWLPDAEVYADPIAAAPPVRRRRRKGRIIAIALCFLAALLSLAVMVGEWWTQTAEADAMLDQIERSEAAMLTAMNTVSTVAKQPGAYDGALSEDAAGELRSAAGEAKAEVFAASDAMRSIAVMPWHQDIENVRQAYLEHSQVWQNFLARAQLEPTSWFVEDPAIEQTWDPFAAQLLDAVPSPDVESLRERAEAILHESDNHDDGGDTLQA